MLPTSARASSCISSRLPSDQFIGIQRGGVALAAIDHVQRFAVAREAERIGRQRIALRNAAERFPAILAALEPFAAAIGHGLVGQTQVEIIVGGEAGIAIVLDQARAFGRAQIDADRIEVFRIAVVGGDQHFVRMLRRQARQIGARVLERRDVGLLVRRQIDAVDVEILVAAFVLRIQHVFAVEGESETAHAAFAVVRDHLGLIGMFARRDENVEHAFVRRDIAEPFSVGTDFARSPSPDFRTARDAE